MVVLGAVTVEDAACGLLFFLKKLNMFPPGYTR
jgi:hypothetical protein